MVVMEWPPPNGVMTMMMTGTLTGPAASGPTRQGGHQITLSCATQLPELPLANTTSSHAPNPVQPPLLYVDFRCFRTASAYAFS